MFIGSYPLQRGGSPIYQPIGGGAASVPVWPQPVDLVQQFNGVGTLPASSWPQSTDLVQEFSGVGASLPYE